MSLADYQNRRFDVLAFRGTQPTGDPLLSQSFFDNTSSGQVCVGIVKLCQRWLLEFLTEMGSMTFQPTRGCTFMTEFRTGTLQTESDVQTAFNFSGITVQRNLQNEEDSTWPNDERFASATLLSITVQSGSIILEVEVTSLAGDSRVPLLPLSVTPELIPNAH